MLALGTATGTDTEIIDCDLVCGHTTNAGSEPTITELGVKLYDVYVVHPGSL